jgi:predicted membrane-bound spermidine synthase
LPQARQAPHVRGVISRLGSVVVLALLLIVVPLFRIRSGLKGLRALAAPLYFACVGLGYLLIEIWLLHRFSMFLGHQAYSLSVVLATLLASTGAGAALGARLGTRPAQRTIVGVMGIVGWLIVGRLGLPYLLDALWATSLVLRVLVAGLFVLPAGLLMGLPFPAGIDWLSTERPAAVAWCVGINFFASVAASVAAIPIAMLSGYEQVWSAGLIAYGVCLLALPLMRIAPERAVAS